MKGFGIEIKNNLLDPKHVERMGHSVWLYMWFIDKMTSVNEEGIGKVLGGKPIKNIDVMKELGISDKTYRRWTKTLSQWGYINYKRTPYGIVFSVNKAFKRFGRRTVTNDLSLGQKRPISRTKMTDVIKTVTVDNNNETKTSIKNPQKNEEEIKEIKADLKRRFTLRPATIS